MNTVKEALDKGNIVLHQMGNSLNTALHSCYDDAGVTPEQHKKAVNELIKSREELQVIFRAMKEMILDEQDTGGDMKREETEEEKKESDCSLYADKGEKAPPAKCCPPISMMEESCSGCIYQFYGI